MTCGRDHWPSRVVVLFAILLFSSNAGAQSGAQIDALNDALSAGPDADVRRALEAAIEADTDAYNIRRQLATLLHDAGDHEAALAHFEVCLGHDSWRYSVMPQAIQCAAELGDMTRALEWAREFVDVCPAWFRRSHSDGTFAVIADEPGYAEILDAYLEQGDARREWHPAWSQDSSRVLFSCRPPGGGGGYDLFTVKADGTDLRRVTRTLHNEIHPSWSHDGTRVVCTTMPYWPGVRSGGSVLQIIDTRTLQIRTLGLGGLTGAKARPSCAARADKIVFVCNATGEWQVYITDSSGTQATQLTNSPGRKGNPTLSPDAKTVLFDTPTVDPQTGQTGRSLATMPADGSAPPTIFAGGLIFDANFDPTQQQVVATYYTKRGDIGTSLAIYGVDGTGPRLITPDGLEAWWSDWSPDGQSIVFSAPPRLGAQEQRLMIYDLETESIRTLIDPSQYNVFIGNNSTNAPDA